MLGKTVFSAVVASLLLACGGSDLNTPRFIVGSCSVPAQSACIDYNNTQPIGYPQADCTTGYGSAGGVYSSSPCPTAGRVGTCATFSKLVRWYPPVSSADAAASCLGAWLAD